MPIKLMKAIKKTFATALLLSAFSTPVFADSFYMNYQNLDGVTDWYSKCTDKCPEIDHQLIETGHTWLDNIINKDVISSLDLGDYEEGSLPDRQWKEFLANPNPSKVQMTNQLNRAILSTVKANSDFIADMDADTTLRYSVSAKPSYNGNKDNLQMFDVFTDRYLGGAHGVANDSYYVFDMTAKKQLKLDDILMPNQKIILEKIVKRQYEDYLKKNGMNPKEMAETWQFFLTDNFTFNKDGLHFLYQPYEITAYVMGMPEFTVPYSQLKGIVKPQYL